MFIAYTTVPHREHAERLAADAVAHHLAVCVQIEGPISSFYQWQGRLERAEEFRLSFKCLPTQLAALEKHVLEGHPYDTPQWLVIQTVRVGEVLVMGKCEL